MAGDYYNSAKENAANRAKVAPSLFTQIFSGIENFIEDITNPIPNQDRGGAVPATGADVLVINAQNTPPAAHNGQAENQEVRGQFNEPQFRFVSVLTTPTLSAVEPKGKDQSKPLGEQHVPDRKGVVFDSKAILGGKIPTGKKPRNTILATVNGRRLLQTAQNSIEPSGFSSGASGGASASTPSTPSRSSNVFYGGGCFSGNVKILTPEGWVRFDELEEDCMIVNLSGIRNAKLIVHPDYSGLLLDMGEGLLVTHDHLMRNGQGAYVPAFERFNGAPKVTYKKKPVYNLHIETISEFEKHYLLENLEIAHNLKKA